MDNPGWSAQRRAQRDDVRYDAPQRGPDGRFRPAQEVQRPLNQPFIGRFNVDAPLPPLPFGGEPIQDNIHVHGVPTSIPVYPYDEERQASTSPSVTSALRRMTAVERSNYLRVQQMHPHLQFMVGPLLRYDTVDERSVWKGAVLVVTADAGSIYDPHPMLMYQWDPDMQKPPKVASSQGLGYLPFNLGPHPADPSSTPLASDGNLSHRKEDGYGPNFQQQYVPGHEIYVYEGVGGTFTFWRFLIDIPLGESEMNIVYQINDGQQLDFFVPGRTQNMKWAAYSCNGFSSGVNPDDFRGPGFKSGYDPVWTDLLAKHAQEPFHALVGGGDQLYCDGIVREPELQEWLKLAKPADKQTYQVTEEISLAIDRFYFNHYCEVFRSGAFARANSSIPMVNMCDDHDLIDGFGSYPNEFQLAPIFRAIGSRGYFFFLLFQCFITVAVDGLNEAQHSNKSVIIGSTGPYVPFPSHSFLTCLGPKVYMLLLDCRAERRKDQVCSPYEYEKVMERLQRIPEGVEHLVVQLGIPIAYPRMVFLETALESKFNPFIALGKTGAVGMSGLVNKFNADAELLDDLNDHWTATGHKKERNWFIQKLQEIAKAKHVRVTFLSGDVHCAAVGVLKTLGSGKNKAEGPDPSMDYRYMLNVVTSAIVNTPPPLAVLTMVSTLGSKTHKTMHHVETDESMIPLFHHDTNGSVNKHKFVMGRRNWCAVRYDLNGELEFDIRVEREKGHGETVGYPVRAPPPRWTF